MSSNYCIREIELTNQYSIRISQEIESDVGGVVWDSSLVAVYYFLKLGKGYWQGKNVLELGAGTGACGISLAFLDAKVIMTDLPERMPLLVENTKNNVTLTRENIKTFPLDWTSYDKSSVKNIDVVVFIDCIYYINGVKPLIDLLREIDASESYCIYEKRDIGEPAIAQKMFLELVSNHFDISYVKGEELDSCYSSEDIPVLRLCRKSGI
ncbi:unnamed protein product [Auanema sp. JU1783]|nr:unnamed protein product [Auanema sp. JU1783]